MKKDKFCTSNVQTFCEICLAIQKMFILFVVVAGCGRHAYMVRVRTLNWIVA